MTRVDVPTIPAEFLARYSVAAPRYTSYPTAVDWRDDLDPASYPARLARAAADPGPVAIYVHVPFCEQLCLFCGCQVVITRDHGRATAYLDDLEQEVAAVAATGIGRRPVSQLHWGGGTPTFLGEAELARLFELLRAAFAFEPGAEIAIEVDPRHTTAEQVRRLAALGFNRISAGVQDFDPVVQKAVHRVQSEAQTRAVIDEARAAGFQSVNIDLIHGLPHQTPSGFDRTLDRVLDARPDRIALFHYAHVPWMRKHQEALPADAFPSPEARAEVFLNALRRLGDAGYVAIGLDHFALPDDELARAHREGTLQRNFMGYTTRRSDVLIPLGPSSIGEIAGAFVQNARDLDGWSAPVRAGGCAITRGHVLDRDDALRRDVIMRVMCKGRIDMPDVERAHGVTFSEVFRDAIEDLAPLERDGLVTRTAEAIEATPLGRVFLRNVAAPFDRYLRARRARDGGTSRTFSRTI